MKKFASILVILLVAAFALTGCVTGKKIPTDKPLDLAGYELVFSDDFNGDKLDTSKWVNGKEDGHARRGAWYVNDAEHLFVKDGALTIRTNYQNGAYGEGWYTSWIESSVAKQKDVAPNEYNGFASTFGYYEVSCIAPPTYGIWSAFWLMPDDATGMSPNDVQNTGEDGVEIDVMESPFYNGALNKGITQHVLHGDGYSKGGNILKTHASERYQVPDMYQKFNTYGVLWTETEYVFYINRQETWRSQHTWEDITLGTAQVAEFMILSVEVSGEVVEGKPVVDEGSWAGNANKNDKTKAFDFIIDSIKVYQKLA